MIRPAVLLTAAVVLAWAVSAQATILTFMTDVDHQEEVRIFVNDQGSLVPPEAILSGSGTESAMLDIPAQLLRRGDNEIKFVFASDLGGTTTGFAVKNAILLVD